MSKRVSNKYFRAIPGIAVMLFFVVLFSSVFREDRECKGALERNGKVVRMYVVESRKGVKGNGSICVYTTFGANYKGKSLQARYNNFIEVLPEGLPIYVKYSFDCEDCYEFLLDSIVRMDDFMVEYSYVKHKGNTYKITEY